MPGGQYSPLKEREIQKILDASFTILSEIGIEVHSRLAFEAFQTHGAACDASKRRVGLSRSMVEDAIDKAPKKIVLCGREEKHDIYCEGQNVHFGTCGTILNVIDDEILGMVMRAVRGIEVTDETIALEIYRRVGPGGNFLADPHTVQWMRKEHFIPKLSNRQLRANWEQSGRSTAEQKAAAMAKQILKKHRPLGLAKELNDRLRAEFPEIKP